MIDDKAVMQQAIDALEVALEAIDFHSTAIDQIEAAITDLKQAIAQPVETAAPVYFIRMAEPRDAHDSEWHEATKSAFDVTPDAWKKVLYRQPTAIAQPVESIDSQCRCEACLPQGNLLNLEPMRFIVCTKCGYKRCPHATNHLNTCTGSNDVGQKGSSWEGVKPFIAQPAKPSEISSLERGWTCQHPKYGTWFISRAAVIADLKQDHMQAYPKEVDYEPCKDAIEVWHSEQTSWCEIYANGVQIQRPDLTAHEACWLNSMSGDIDLPDDLITYPKET